MLAIVEHTNFVSKKHYNNHFLTYFGKYTKDSSWLNASPQQLLKKYQPMISKLSPEYEKSILNSWTFQSSFAQPITYVNHGSKVPKISTPLQNIYWASMQHVYPWDRGTNYAVKLGIEAAKQILAQNDQS